jgi:hypothetical protein
MIPKKPAPDIDQKRVHARLSTRYGWIPVSEKIMLREQNQSGMTIRREVIPL